MTINEILGETAGDPNVIDSGGEYKLDWNWTMLEAKDGSKGGEANLADVQLVNVTNRAVTINNVEYTEVRRASTRRDFRIEDRKRATTTVLQTFDWGYTWNNDNAAWTNDLNPPPPNGDTCAGDHIGAGEIKDVVGITGIPW